MKRRPETERENLLARVDAIVRAVCDEIETELLPEAEEWEDWQFSFRVGRKIQAALVEEGISPQTVDPETIARHVAGISNCFDLYSDEIELSFIDGWSRIELPDGFTPLEYAYSELNRSRWRAPLSSEFPNESIAQCAEDIATVFALLQRQQGPTAEVYASDRSLGKLMGKSREFARRVKNRLIQDGTLQAIRPATRTEAAKLRYVEPRQRQPLLSKDPKDPEVL